MGSWTHTQEALEHEKYIAAHYLEESHNSFLATSKYSSHNFAYLGHIRTTDSLAKGHLVPQDSVSCLFSLPSDGRKVAILNYASYKNPGGRYIDGAWAQEEALCHESNLYSVLNACEDIYYKWNRAHLNKALYFNRALYSPGIIFEKNGEKRTADVITCAAPNFSAAGRFQNVSRSENNKVFEDRMKFMLAVADTNNVDILIAGAWGCGVFQQNPTFTCQALTKAIRENSNIKEFYYAIPGGSYDGNFVAFKEVLQCY